MGCVVCRFLYSGHMDEKTYRDGLWKFYRIPTEEMIMASSFDSLLRKLRMTEKRQREALADTQAQIKALEALAKKQ